MKTTTWERFAGREDRFAVRISFRGDPDPGYVDPDEALSWGTLQIWAEGKNLCAHTDQGETLDHVHWYLLSLLEWFAKNWDPLLHEERLPGRTAGATAIESLRATVLPPPTPEARDAEAWEMEWFEWSERHGIRAARDGGAFPDLLVRRWRDRVEFSWGNTALEGADELEFLASSGTSRLDPLEVAGPLLEVLRAASAELVARSKSERLEALVTQVAALESPERHSERLAWMAGLRMVGNSFRESWKTVENAFSGVSEGVREAALGVVGDGSVIQGSCQAALLFGAVAPDIAEEDVQRLAELLIEQYSPDAENAELRQLSGDRPLPRSQPPWQDGYAAAEETREALGLTPEEPPNLNALFERVGIELRDLTLSDSSVRGIAVAGPDHTPTIATNRHSVYGTSRGAERFALSHELCHLLCDRSAGRRLAVASGAWAPREIEQRANAFAAAFLMPPEGLWSAVFALEAPISSMEGVEELAKRFDVSAFALIEHLPNVGLIRYADRERLRRELRQ